MDRTYIKDLKGKVGSQAKVCGFVQTIRKQGGIIFLVLRDVTGIIQAVVLKGDSEVFEKTGRFINEEEQQVACVLPMGLFLFYYLHTL